MIEPLYEGILKLYVQKMCEAKSYCVTFDLWTSVAKTKYLGVTYHWIDKDFILNSGTLTVLPMTSSARAGYMADLIQRRTDELFEHMAHKDIPLLAASVTDGASNVRLASAMLTGNDACECVNHGLKLVVEGSISACEAVQKDFSIVHAISACINSSSSLTKNYKGWERRRICA